MNKMFKFESFYVRNMFLLFVLFEIWILYFGISFKTDLYYLSSEF